TTKISGFIPCRLLSVVMKIGTMWATEQEKYTVYGRTVQRHHGTNGHGRGFIATNRPPRLGRLRCLRLDRAAFACGLPKRRACQRRELRVRNRSRRRRRGSFREKCLEGW